MSAVSTPTKASSAPQPRQRWVVWALLAILLFAAVFDMVFYTGFYASDDLQYLRGATEIAETGRLSSLTLGTIRIVLLLPIALLIRLAGHQIFALTASFALYHLMLVLATYWLGWRLHGSGPGLLAAGSIALLPVVAGFATAILPEHAMAALVVFAVATLHLAGEKLCSIPRSPRAGYALSALAGFLFALAFAAKVVAIIILPVLAVLILSWFRKAPAPAVVKAGLLFLLGALICGALVSLCFHALIGLYSPLQDPTFVDNLRIAFARPPGKGIVAPLERLAKLISFGRHPAFFGVFFWAIPISVLLYPALRRRSWLVLLSFIWPCAYLTWGSFSLTKYMPAPMQVRYFIFALPFAAIMWSFLAYTLFASLWLRLRVVPRLRPVLIALLSALGLAVIANCATCLNRLAGKLYCAPEVAGVRYALDFAASSDDRPVVLSYWLSARVHPLFRRGKHPRLILTGANTGIEDMRDHLAATGFLYLESALGRSPQRSYPTPSPLDRAIAEASGASSSDLRLRTLGSFAQFKTRLSGLRYLFGGSGADMDLRDDKRAVFLREVTRPQQRAQPIPDGAGQPIDLSRPGACAPTWAVRVSNYHVSPASDGGVVCDIEGSDDTTGGQYGGIRFTTGPLKAIRLDVTFDTPDTIAAVFMDLTAGDATSQRLRWQFTASSDTPVPYGRRSYTFRLDQSTGPFSYAGGPISLQDCDSAHLFVRLKGTNARASFQVHRVLVERPAP